MKKTTLLILFCSSFGILFSQRSKVDSLLRLLSAAKEDTIKCKLLNELIESENDENKWPVYNKQLKELATAALKKDKVNRRFFRKQLADALGNEGYLEEHRGNAIKALELHEQSLIIHEELNDLKGKAANLNNIGIIYNNKGSTRKAIEYFQKALLIDEQINDTLGLSYAYNNLGLMNRKLGNQRLAKEYFEKSLNLRIKGKDKSGMASAINNLALLFQDKDDYKNAEIHFIKCLKLQEEIDDKHGLALTYNNIALNYKYQGNKKECEKYLIKSLELRERLGVKKGIASSLRSTGRYYFEEKNYALAKKYSERAYQISNELGLMEYKKSIAYDLYQLYKHTNEQNKAFRYLETYTSLKDSLSNLEEQKATIKLMAEIEFEKKLAISETEHKAKLEIEKQRSEKEKTKQFLINLTGSSILLIVLIFSYILFKRFKLTQKQKQIIEEQKKLVDEKNDEITASITYAKRIQHAILPNLKAISNSFQNSFVIYKPKDIVAGDFYWLERTGDTTLIAVADCTGHGVPGALVSVICNNSLNRSVREFKLTDPGKILDKTRELVIEEFEKSDEEVKDGMDISLLSVNKLKNEIKWSGANNPLWILRAASGSIEEIKPDKQPIGKYMQNSNFSSHSITLNEGDRIYLFTDGILDQFGGPQARLTDGTFGQGKKFKSKQFRLLLQSLHAVEINNQKELIESTFNEWKRDLEQVDDVCVIGIRI